MRLRCPLWDSPILSFQEREGVGSSSLNSHGWGNECVRSRPPLDLEWIEEGGSGEEDPGQTGLGLEDWMIGLGLVRFGLVKVWDWVRYRFIGLPVILNKSHPMGELAVCLSWAKNNEPVSKPNVQARKYKMLACFSCLLRRSKKRKRERERRSHSTVT